MELYLCIVFYNCIFGRFHGIVRKFPDNSTDSVTGVDFLQGE